MCIRDSVYSVLLVAALEMNAARGALTMAAFGAGTIPAMLLGSYGASRVVRLAARPLGRKLTGVVLLASAVVTLVGPWWMEGRHDAHAAHRGSDVAAVSYTHLRAHE